MSDVYSMPLSVTSQFYFCPMPLRLDTYSGCTNNCLYCFANNSMQKYMNTDGDVKLATLHDDEFVKASTLQHVKKYFDIAFEGAPNNFKEQEGCAIEALRRRIPIHFGGMSDPFQPKEKKSRVTLEVLKLLKSYNYPVVLSTKCKLIMEPEYREIIDDYENFGLQVSLIDTRQEVMDLIEPGVGKNSVQDRLDILETYKHKWTAIRIQPVIINLNEPIIPDLLQKCKDRDVNHAVVEGLKFMNSNKTANIVISKAFKKITGESFDLAAHYKAIGGKVSGNDIELPTWRKNVYVKKFKKVCKDLGITYGAADNDLRLEGETPCCCGNEQMPGYDNVCKHNIGYAVFRAKAKGVPITYDLIKDEWFWKGDFRMIISQDKLSRKLGRRATRDDSNIPLMECFMKQWNNNGKNSPCQHCSVKKRQKLDEDGNKTYIFKDDGEMKELLKPINQKTLFSF
jgi:DNA repair photolyase